MSRTFKDSFVGFGIETPSKVTRRGYRCKESGVMKRYPVQTSMHYSDKPRVFSRGDVIATESLPSYARLPACEKWERLLSRKGA